MPTKKQYNQQWTHEKYLSALKEIGSKVIPLEEYSGMHTKILHRCQCGNEWKVVPLTIRNGGECQQCKKQKNSSAQPIPHSAYVKRIEHLDVEVIGKYKNSITKIEHRCNCGESFLQTPSKIIHSEQIRCKKCHRRSEGFHGREFYRNKKTWLYYLKIGELYKIGVTIDRGGYKSSIKERYQREIKRGMKFNTIESFIFQDGSDAYDIEQFVINNNKCDRYVGEDVLKSGNSELFITDIFKE